MSEDKRFTIRDCTSNNQLFPSIQPKEPKEPTISKSASEVLDLLLKQAHVPRDNGELYEVVIEAEVKESIKNGKYVWDGTKATIRDAKTKRIVDHIEVKKASPSIMNALSSALTSVVGEVQLAQIMAKLDEMQKSIEEVNLKIDMIQSAKLMGTVNTINQVLYIDNLDRKNRMLESVVQQLNESASYYFGMYQEQMNSEPGRHLAKDVLEGITEIFGYKPGTEQFFLNVTKEFNKTTSYFNLYLLAMVSLIKVNQVLENYQLSQSAVDNLGENLTIFEDQLVDRAKFYFNITSVNNNDLEKLFLDISQTYQMNIIGESLEVLRNKFVENKKVIQKIESLGQVKFEICEEVELVD